MCIQSIKHIVLQEIASIQMRPATVPFVIEYLFHCFNYSILRGLITRPVAGKATDMIKHATPAMLSLSSAYS